MIDEPEVIRLESGVAGLDVILHGGFIQGGIYLIQGNAGSGKTILGNQLCCHRVVRGGKALFVTLLSESVDRMLLNIGKLGFFDPSAIPQSLHYVSGLAAFEAEGLKGLLEFVRREVRARNAELVVLDGLDGLGASEEPASASASLGEFTHQLQTQNSMLGCTTIMLSRKSHVAHAERTIVDGLIELSEPLSGALRERRLELLVFRGSNHLRGQHSYEIGAAGLRVYPRLEAVVTRTDSAPVQGAPPLHTGSGGLDNLLGGEGSSAPSSLLLTGPAGSGKSALALSFMSPCGGGERGLYLSFSQGAARAREHAQRLGFDLAGMLEDGCVQWQWRAPCEDTLDALGHQLLELASQTSVTRIAIDGLEGLALATSEPTRLLPFLGALLDALRARHITTLCTLGCALDDRDDARGASTRALAHLFDHYIALDYVAHGNHFKRTLSVLKSPGRHQPTQAEFAFGPTGVTLAPGPLWGESSAPEAPVLVATAGSSSKPPARAKTARRK